MELTGGPGATVTVTNGPATEPISTHSGGGTGLLGLRTAVTAVGGTFEAGPHGGGYRVRARVPERAGGPSAPSRAPSAPFTRARRRVATALGAAAGAGVALVAAAAGWYAYTETHAVLEPAAYATLRPGAPLTSSTCPAGRSRTRRPTGPPPRPRAPTAATTVRAANCSSPSTTTGSASTTRAV